MNRAATLTLNAPLLMLVAALALSTLSSPPAPRRPFLDFMRNSKPSNLRRKKKTMPQAQNKHKKAARAQIIKKPVPTPHNYKKESPASRRRLHKMRGLAST
ncbi:hypothetical protein MJK72_05440 [Klebsiella pneumoniae]|nr:hypothetical protein MJK72_05440 [Klebsiella pneumoniae]